MIILCLSTHFHTALCFHLRKQTRWARNVTCPFWKLLFLFVFQSYKKAQKSILQLFFIKNAKPFAVRLTKKCHNYRILAWFVSFWKILFATIKHVQMVLRAQFHSQCHKVSPLHNLEPRDLSEINMCEDILRFESCKCRLNREIRI